jgi:hypothetical protein
MNLIEIAEDLKDLPDQYLMQEIQQPTGNFPSYLIVSELGRRKRMRDKVAKEMPSQTVAQELATPPQMPQQMPQGMAPQGLMAMPQAQTELAAQDAMGTTPPEMMMPTQQMAGGGIVSFRDGGDVQRFQNQGFVNAGLGSTFDGFDLPMGDGVDFEFPNLTDEQKLEYIQGRVGYPQIAALREGTISLDEIFRDVYRPPSTTTAPPRAAPAATPVDNRALLNQADAELRSQPGDPPPPAGPTFRDQISQILSRETPAPPTARYTPAGLPSFASAEERNAARERKIAEFEQAVPDRATPFYQEDIARREKDIEGRRESNINEALIQAGLGIMGSKSPRFLGAVSEGGTAGLNALRQGRKDINQSEEALRAARAKMIESQTLRDQGKFGAGKEARAEAKEDYDRALSLYNTEESQKFRQAQLASENYRNQLIDSANRQRLGLEALKLQREAEQDPIKKRLIEAQIKQAEAAAEASLRLKALSAADRLLLEQQAKKRLEDKGFPSPTSEQIDAEIAAMRGVSGATSVAPREIEYPG